MTIKPANSPCAPEFGCRLTAANPVMSRSTASRPAITSAYPAAWSAGANGCTPANSGQVTASMMVAALSFIVQEPSGIMEVSRPTSLRSSAFRKRIIEVSE